MGGCVSKPNLVVYCRQCGERMGKDQLQSHRCRQKTPQPTIPMVKTPQPSPVPQNFMKVQPPKVIPNPFLPFLNPAFPPPPNPLEPQLYRGEAREIPNQFVNMKVPCDPERTIFKWVKQPTIYYPTFIKGFKPQIMILRTFQQKLLWFRLNIQDLRVSWQKGCETLSVDRSNLIQSSLYGLKNINLRKQLKIKFDDQVVDDAGGLLREWMHLLIKQIFSQRAALFKQCVTEETAYKFIWDKIQDEQLARNYVHLLGIIIGKAIFDRISISCYLNRTILRQICQQTVLMNDVYSFDKDFYKSWKSILENQGASQLCLYFTQSVVYSDGSSQQFDLVQNGKAIEVTDKNKSQYLYELIQLYCYKSVSKHIKVLVAGVTKVVPPQLMSVFQPHELQMMLNGPQVIDVKDWKQNTLYKGYTHNDQMIIWFWTVVQKYNQKQLANLLHYCTGSTRVPILGFKYLQSNRNTVNRFTIEKGKYDKHNPYPKSYTCFNRLQLPEYSSMKDLQKNLNIVISQEITTFGLG